MISFDDDFGPQVQKKFLSLLIFDQTWAKVNGFEIVKPEYFENDIFYTICTWIHDYYKKYKNPPTHKSLNQLIEKDIRDSVQQYKFKAIIDEIFELEEATDLEFFKDRATVFARQVCWNKALETGKEVLKQGNFEQALNAFKKVLSIGGDCDLGLDFNEMSADGFLDLLAESYDPGSMLKTGIRSWDNALGGGFVKRNVHIIGAPPGAGKSRIMSYLAKNALYESKKVIFLTLELSEAETMANICTSATGLGLHEMLIPANREEFISKLNTFKSAYGKDLVVKFYKPGCVTADTLTNYIYKVIQKKEEKGFEWKPDIIFVDYLDKLLPTQKIKGNSYEDVGGVATDLKNLGITFDCPVITGSQLGKYTWNLTGDAVVSMDAIAESAQKVHICHSMTTINTNKNEKQNGKARLYLAKSRSGRPGSIVWIENNLGRCSIREVDEWDPNSLSSSGPSFTVKERL